MSLTRSFACLPLLFSTLAFAAGPNFQARKDLKSPFANPAIEMGDFNGDGKPDMAAVSTADKRIAIFLNDGQGGFRAPVFTSVVTANAVGLTAIAVGDFNEDGRLDAVIGDTSGGSAYLMLGNGDGTFTQSTQLGMSFSQQAVADINGDKHLDIIGTYSTGQAPMIALGDGKGSFRVTSLPSPTAASQVGGTSYGFLETPVVGDFNGDKRPDVVVGTMSFQGGQVNALLVYSGIGDGTFNQPAVYTDPTGLPIASFLDKADFDGDGKLDLLAGSSNNAAILRGNGDATFNYRINSSQSLFFAGEVFNQNFGAGQNLVRVIAVDANGDGATDVVTAGAGSRQFGVLLNDGKGTFAQTKAEFSAQLAGEPIWLRTADLNGDGLPDFIVSDISNQQISYFLSSVKAVPSVAISGPSQMVVGTTATMTARVTGTAGVATGVVTVTEGATSLGQGTLLNGAASIPVSGLALGGHTLTVSYAGDATYASGVSGSATLMVVSKQTLPIESSIAAPTYLVGQVVPVTMKLGPSTFSPTGTFTLMDGDKAVDAVTLRTLGGGLGGGIFSTSSISTFFRLSNLAAGTHTFTVNYSGDDSFLPATGVAPVTVAIADASLNLAAVSQTVAAGANATYSIALAPVGGFNGTVAFSCTGLPAGYSCAGNTVTLNGQAATGTVTVTTTKAAALVNPFRTGGLVLATVFFVWCGRRRRVSAKLLMLVAAASLSVLAMSGCSGGSSNSSSSSTGTTTTPTAQPVTTNFTIVATLTQGSATATHNISATLVVQ